MLDYTRYTCPVCHRAFSSGEDIVVCPQCGAPHHRACFHSLGHCAYDTHHGTSLQWKPDPQKDDEHVRVCGNCGTVNADGLKVCRKCGHNLLEPLPAPSSEQPQSEAAIFYSQFSPYIGIDPDSCMDGCPARDIAGFVGARADYYLARFHFMRSQKTKNSWNWAAALFPVGWALYRKLYKPFVILLLLSILLSIPTLMMTAMFGERLMHDPSVWENWMFGGLLSRVEISMPAWLIAASNLAGMLQFGLRAYMATRANHLYYRHVLQTVSQCRCLCTEPSAWSSVLAKKGNASWKAVVLFESAVLIGWTAIGLAGVFLFG